MHTCLATDAVYHVEEQGRRKAEAEAGEEERVGRSWHLHRGDIGDSRGFHKKFEEGVGLEGRLQRAGPGVRFERKERGGWSTVSIYPRNLQNP